MNMQGTRFVDSTTNQAARTYQWVFTELKLQVCGLKGKEGTQNTGQDSERYNAFVRAESRGAQQDRRDGIRWLRDNYVLELGPADRHCRALERHTALQNSLRWDSGDDQVDTRLQSLHARFRDCQWYHAVERGGTKIVIWK